MPSVMMLPANVSPAVGVEGQTAKLVDAVYAGGRVIDIQAERYAKPLMVKNVERFRLELDGEAFIDPRVLEHRHVGLC